MKCSPAVLVSIVLAVALQVVADDKFYTSKYDNINLDEILDSKRLVSNYVQCLLGNKACSPEGSELKKILPDALKTQCAKCTENQKQGALKVVQRLQKDYPDEWKLLLDKWDPKREYFTKFEEYMKSQKQ
ncbi:ejaculatory bulb-specific protein 3-like [Lycorma delicatula]|uniref:ejaculatory bulb-specific protein 3-like n=1 Tax=Lycorma delicatula TaxID=130591 RepID=UPI003F515B71